MAPARCQKSFAPGRASHKSRPCAAPYFCVLGMRESASPISTPRLKHITCGSGLDREQHSALPPSKNQTRLNPSRQPSPGPYRDKPSAERWPIAARISAPPHVDATTDAPTVGAVLTANSARPFASGTRLNHPCRSIAPSLIGFLAYHTPSHAYETARSGDERAPASARLAAIFSNRFRVSSPMIESNT